MVHRVIVEDQSLRWYGRPPKIADNSIEFVQLQFHLPEEWASLLLVAQFTQSETYNMLMTDDRCSLPVELKAGLCKVSLFGYSEGKPVRATSIPLVFQIEESGFVSSAETPIPPTPDLYAQLIEYFSSLVGSGGSGTGGTVTPEDIAKAVEDYLSKNPPEVPDLSDEVERAETAAQRAESANSSAQEALSGAAGAASSASNSARQAQASAGSASDSAGYANTRANEADAAATKAEEAASDAEAAAARAEEAAKVTTDLDTTLTQAGKAADAKAVGDAISKLSGGKGDFVVQDTAPEDTSVLWVDPSDTSSDSGEYVAYDEAQELTPEQQAQALNNIGAMPAEKFNKIFDTFPTVEEINALSNWEFFTTRGFYSKNDGLGATYLVRTSSSSFCIPYGDRYFRPVVTDWNTRDIFVDLYGVRRCAYDDANFADISARNSEIMSALASTLQNGFTFHFLSGHYYFASPIVLNKYTTIKGVSGNACVYGNQNVNSDSNYGTYLHFPNLSDGEAAISILGGVVEDLGISGNPSICNVSLNRSNSVINPNNIVSLVDTGTTYGIKVKDNHTIHNVKVRNCTYGIYAESTNALISNIDVRYCKVGISVGNDIKVNNVQAWNVMVGVELRGQLASASNVRGDSIGKHLIECKKGKCLLTNIDGDYCMGSLIHYGGGDIKYIHLGQATSCMGRIATKYAYPRSSGFDLQNVPADDYEYCSYISIAPNTQVFGGQLDLVNVSTNPLDTSSSYVHPNAVISIGTGSTVKGVLITCDIPNDANVEYFNAKVIKSLSTHAEADNDTSAYLTNFDGNTIEDIGFITPSRFVRSLRTKAASSRTLVSGISISAQNIKDSLGYTPADKADTSVVTDMVVGVGVSVPSINLNDGVYEYGRFAAAGTEYSDSNAFRNKNYLPVTGGRTIACWFAKADWNKNNIGFSVQIVQYDATKTKLTNRMDMNNYALNARPSFTLEENTAFIRISVYPDVSFSTPLTDIELAVYYIEDVTLGYVSPEPTLIGEKKLSLEESVIPSSTPGSSKKFRLTVDDSGIITAVEIT